MLGSVKFITILDEVQQCKTQFCYVGKKFKKKICNEYFSKCFLLSQLYWLQQQHDPYFVQRGPSVSVKAVGPSQLGELMQVVVNPFLNKPLFYWYVVNTGKKEKLLLISNFSFSHSFLPFLRTLHHFHQILK